MRFMGRKKSALIVLFIFLVPLLLRAQVVSFPKGWKTKKPDSSTLTLYNPNQVEGVKFSLASPARGTALQQLHQIFTALRTAKPDVRSFNVKADQNGRFAECEFLLTGVDYSHTKKIKLHERFFLISAGDKSLIALEFAKASIYPRVEKSLNQIVNSAFAAPEHHPQGQKSSSTIDWTHVPFKTVNAGLYWIKIPSTWRVTLASNGNFQAWSPNGETVFIFSLELPGDNQTYRNVAEGYRLIGVSPEQLAVGYRLVSPPLSPRNVVQVLYPRVAGGTVEQMNVLGAQDVPPSAGTRGEQGLVHYQYVLHGGQGNIQMEGTSLVTTVSPQFAVPGANFWTLIAQGVEGPRSLFSKNRSLYLDILRSSRPNSNGIQASLQADAGNRAIIGQMAQTSLQANQQANQMISRTFQNMGELQQQTYNNFTNSNYKSGLGWMETYAGETPVLDIETGGRFVLPNNYVDFFQDRGRDVRAPQNIDPILFNVRPGDVVKPVPPGEW